MPKVLFFPFFGPNRRDDRRLVEIRIDFSDDSQPLDLIDTADLCGVLEADGVISPDVAFPPDDMPTEPRARFARLLGGLAVLFQRQVGHDAELIDARRRETGDAWLVLVGFQHCDVGMTAVKLASEVIQGQRRQLSGPFTQFSRFAQERLVPAETRAILAEAKRRGIPAFQLEQPPFSGAQAGGFRVRPNGLLMLGHGAKSEILDGSFCLSRADADTRELLKSAERRTGILRSLGLSSGLEAARPVRQLIVCGGALFDSASTPGEAQPPLSEQVEKDLQKLRAAVGGQALAVALCEPEPGSWSIFDFFLGPDLGALGEEQLQAAVSALLEELFPGPGAGSIPLVAITGTDGKTTTSRMVDYILRHAGCKPGLVCTDGSYIAGTRVTEKDASTIQGHGRALTHRGIDAAVLESHHRGIAVRGFAYFRSDVGICLNVTEEHIKQGEIESLSEMARVKRAIPERGRNAVIFADDRCCREMIGHLDPERLWLVSLERNMEALRALAGKHPFGCCVLESVEGRECLVLYQDDQRTVLLPSGAIPATFDGTARFNVSNAMHAAIAAHVVGVPAGVICEALTGFEAGSEMTPGRMNVFNQLPFKVIMDFAHTPGGIARIAEFADQQHPAGRKVLAFSGSLGRGAFAWERLGRAAAGHFDLYFCKEYPPREGLPETNAAPYLKEGLLQGGVREGKIRLATHGQDTAFEIFDACAPGDLLIFLVGHTEMKRMATYIEAYLERGPTD